jgi:hypothetical protein
VQVSGFEDSVALGLLSMHQILVDLDPNSRHRMLEQSLMSKVQGTGRHSTWQRIPRTQERYRELCGTVLSSVAEDTEEVMGTGHRGVAGVWALDDRTETKERQNGDVGGQRRWRTERQRQDGDVGGQKDWTETLEDRPETLVWRRGSRTRGCSVAEDASSKVKDAESGLDAELKAGSETGEGALGMGFQKVQERLEKLERTVQGLGEKLDLSLQDLHRSLHTLEHQTSQHPIKYQKLERTVQVLGEKLDLSLQGMVKEMRASRWVEQAHVEARAAGMNQTSTEGAASHNTSDPRVSHLARAARLTEHSCQALQHRALHNLEHHTSLVQPVERTQARTAEDEVEEMALAYKSCAVVPVIHSHPCPNGDHGAKSPV